MPFAANILATLRRVQKTSTHSSILHRLTRGTSTINYLSPHLQTSFVASIISISHFLCLSGLSHSRTFLEAIRGREAAMADEAAEAAFINAMQNNNDAAGMIQGVLGAASQQQTDPASDDEYDPALAVQPDPLTTDAQDLSVLSPSTAVKHDALPSTSTPQNIAFSFATTAPQDLPDLDAQNHSRAMSPDLSQFVKGDSVTVPGPEVGSLPGLPVTEANNMHGDTGMVTVANGDSLEQASHTASSILPDSISTPNVPLHNDVQDRPSSKVVQNGVAPSSSAVPASLSDPAAVAQDNSTAETQIMQSNSQAEVPPATQPVTSPTTALPKARLPHDRIGILEDRIKEDPRGDLDAWLALIGEHRKRGKIDDARNAYERLFTVFPWAVSLDILSLIQLILIYWSRRPINGWRMHRWRMRSKIELDWNKSLAGRWK